MLPGDKRIAALPPPVPASTLPNRTQGDLPDGVSGGISHHTERSFPAPALEFAASMSGCWCRSSRTSAVRPGRFQDALCGKLPAPPVLPAVRGQAFSPTGRSTYPAAANTDGGDAPGQPADRPGCSAVKKPAAKKITGWCGQPPSCTRCRTACAITLPNIQRGENVVCRLGHMLPTKAVRSYPRTPGDAKGANPLTALIDLTVSMMFLLPVRFCNFSV